jgi:tryptophanyl-tRNA synthetase
MYATTYDIDKKNQPGITNLLVLLALLEGKPQENINQEFVGQTSYGTLKQRVAGVVEETLIKLQQAYKQVDEKELEKKLLESEERMREVANATLYKVQKAVGLRG